MRLAPPVDLSEGFGPRSCGRTRYSSSRCGTSRRRPLFSPTARDRASLPRSAHPLWLPRARGSLSFHQGERPEPRPTGEPSPGKRTCSLYTGLSRVALLRLELPADVPVKGHALAPLEFLIYDLGRPIGLDDHDPVLIVGHRVPRAVGFSWGHPIYPTLAVI